MLTESKQPTRIKFQHLVDLYSQFVENKDWRNADKILDIYEKLNKEEFMISFAGHFSAGKSSIINGLLGTAILPKSPIPTSANVVKVQSGVGSARVHFHNGEMVEYKEPYNIDRIKEFAKDKATIKEIEISTSDDILPEGCVLIDTPGIDAADDADRVITESSLHLVDALFYVMDYNHVQSEVNLQFLKKAEDLGIPFFIIINQIDKHDEQELSFNTFENNIKQTFDQWGIMPEEIYYSSMTDTEAPNNQFPMLKQKLFSLMTVERENYLHIDRSVNQIVNEHKTFLNDLFEQKAADLSQEDYEEDNNPTEQLQNINYSIKKIRNKPVEFQNDFRKDMNSTLQNAYLMPAELRDRAEEFLKSQQSDFKVGLFGSKRKTEEERQVRLQTFLDALTKNMESSLEWKLRDKFMNLATEYGINDQDIAEQIQNLSILFDADNLISAQKPGAKVTGDYVLNYTNDVTNQIKQLYKKEALNILEAMEKRLKNQSSGELTHLEKRSAELSEAVENQEKLELLNQKLQENYTAIDTTLEQPGPDESKWQRIKTALDRRYKPVTQVSEELAATEEEIEEGHTVAQSKPSKQVDYTTDQVLGDVETAINLVQSLPGFQPIIDDMKRKADRLEKRSYTIALFGAFSAGKSSFANALIGKNVLPASPNPTTAVINRINPVTEKSEHGTMRIQHKDETTLADDIRNLTKSFSPVKGNLAELLEWIIENNINESDQLNSTHRAYLNAVLAGYADNKHNLSKQTVVTLDDFAVYVTDETKACYIESVDLYYDCPVTRAGITLVDTPGADSVNARHTNVSFDYIKHADAILYVTYYNHALSRADKDFLMQLGRVKDAFQLDKMFFVMNAADLAEDQEECNLVLNYIEEQLALLGIRFPRLYAVSSKQSLHDKQNSRPLNDQMATFEKALYHFIDHELTALSVQSVYKEIQRTLKSVEKYIRSLKLDATEKERFRQGVNEKRTSLKQLADELDPDIYSRRISQKLEKQLFYVLERLSIRFHDMFKEKFNPTTVTESGKKAQEQLQNNLRGLLDYAGYELMQELRAVSLRVESFTQELAATVYEEYTKKSNHIDNEFLLSDYETPQLNTPDYNQAFTNLEVQNFNKELQKFNGTKAFFVKNEKETMKDEIYDRLKPFAKAYLENHHKTMEDTYINQWNVIIENMKQEIHDSIQQYDDSFSAMFTDQTIDLATLTNIHDTLTQIIEEAKSGMKE